MEPRRARVVLVAIGLLGASTAHAAEPPASTGSPASPVAPARGRIVGRVLTRGTRDPVAGAHLSLIPRVARKTADAALPAPLAEADTDANGAFTLADLAPAAYTVVVTGAALERTRFDEALAAGQSLDVRYYVSRTWSSRYETTARGLSHREEVSRQTLSTEELLKMPGSFGDALRSVENLPGIARSPFNAGFIIIRGGKPGDSRYYFAGAEIPQLYHYGGLTSVVPTALIDHIDVLSGNYPARYGRAIAGTIDVELREGKRDRVHGWAETNVFDTGLGVEGPLGKGSFILAVRRSYVDLLLKGVGAAGYHPPGLSFTTAPVYYDYQAILDYPLWGGKFRAAVIGDDDQLRLVFDRPQDADSAVAGAFTTHVLFHRLQLRWTRTVGKWSLLFLQTTGYNQTDFSLGQLLNFSVGVVGSDWRIEARHEWSKDLKLVIGADPQFAWTTLSALVPQPVREGQQPVPISPANRFRRDDKFFTGTFSLYAELAARPIPWLTITPGLRLDYFSSVNRWQFDPRLSLRAEIGKWTAIRVGVGLYTQDPAPQDYDKVFGNPNLSLEQAVHYALSVEQNIAPGLRAEITGFYKQLFDLSAPTSARVLRDGAAVPERVVSLGSGRVYGGEFMVRQAVSKYFFGWISYTLMRSERRDCPTCAYRLFDYDQTHILILALHANLPRGFEVGLRFRYISGLPYTPVRAGQYDADADLYTPGTFATNSGRLAAYHQLDFRVDKTFEFQRWLLKIYLDIYNVYNQGNAEQTQYSFDYKKSAPITGLPIIPSFGLRAEF